MRHIKATTHPLRAARRGQVRALVVVIDDGRARALRALRLMLPLLLLFFLALSQVASAHQAGGQHQPHATQMASHHAKADMTCCGDLSQDEDNRACLAQCLASCSYCAPLPLQGMFPAVATALLPPATADPLHGAIASPYLRPPSFS